LAPIGLPAEKFVAKTFHAFGLDIIGAATGKTAFSPRGLRTIKTWSRYFR
jgi:hypothetical protein